MRTQKGVPSFTFFICVQNFKCVQGSHLLHCAQLTNSTCGHCLNCLGSHNLQTQHKDASGILSSDIGSLSSTEKLSLQYAIRLAANPSNPAHEVTFPPNYVDLYE